MTHQQCLRKQYAKVEGIWHAPCEAFNILVFAGITKDFWKRVLSYWSEDSDVHRYTDWLVGCCDMPNDYGRLVMKAQQRLTKLTAHEWRTWCVVQSQVVLRSLPQPEDETSANWKKLISAWDQFVSGVRLITTYSVTVGHVNEAQEHFRQHCCVIQEVWGGPFMKPNHHHLMHICQCIINFGPPHVFWVFAFERYNGFLARFPSSQRSVELEMMKRFLSQQLTINSDETLSLSIASSSSSGAHASSHVISMQAYKSLPLILRSKYNWTWFRWKPYDVFPYAELGLESDIDAINIAAADADADADARTPPLTLPAHAQAGMHAAARMLAGSQQAASMSSTMTPPDVECFQSIYQLMKGKTEEKAGAIAFVPSTKQEWRELLQ